jgi:hypothetical protein
MGIGNEAPIFLGLSPNRHEFSLNLKNQSYANPVNLVPVLCLARFYGVSPTKIFP